MLFRSIESFQVDGLPNELKGSLAQKLPRAFRCENLVIHRSLCDGNVGGFGYCMMVITSVSRDLSSSSVRPALNATNSNY